MFDNQQICDCELPHRYTTLEGPSVEKLTPSLILITTIVNQLSSGIPFDLHNYKASLSTRHQCAQPKKSRSALQ
jgi:hypothetical protein